METLSGTFNASSYNFYIVFYLDIVSVTVSVTVVFVHDILSQLTNHETCMDTSIGQVLELFNF